VTLGELQAVLDRSFERAQPFTRSFLPATAWRAEAVQEFINATRNMTVAVVRRDGRPHAAPVIAACTDGTIYFSVSPGSVLMGCLERDPAVAFTVTDVARTLIGSGSASAVARSLEAPELMATLDRAAGLGHFTPPGWDGWVYSVAPARLFAA
jgi:hypothetical protein